MPAAQSWSQKASVLALAAAFSFSPATSLTADLWQGLYGKQPPAPEAIVTPPVPQPMAKAPLASICLNAIFNAQARFGIPDNLLLAIGIQEAGRQSDDGLTVWPWAVNANGKGRYFQTQQDALAWVAQQRDQGITNIDVGCMQINQRWHGQAFQSVEHAMDPQANVDYAAKFLSDLYRQEGDWVRAAGRYHSSTPEVQTVYLETLIHNLNVANTRLPVLKALADGAVVAAAEPAVQAPSPRAPEPTGELWFTSRSQSGQAFSLYSSSPMQPILPNLQDTF